MTSDLQLAVAKMKNLTHTHTEASHTKGRVQAIT